MPANRWFCLGRDSVLLSLLLLLMSVALAQRPQLLVLFDGNEVLAPGTPLPFEEFADAESGLLSLPQRGRYLLWLIDGAAALETEAEIAPPPDAPEGSPGQFNETILLPSFEELGPAYIVFFESGQGEMPVGAERAQVHERFGDHTVLFDDDGVVPTVREDGNNVNPRGLYLIDEGIVRYRYAEPYRWDVAGVVELIVEGARAFLEGRDPPVYPSPLRAVGAELPDDFPVQEEPLLLLELTGLAAEAPEDGVVIRREEGLGGAFGAAVEWTHPGAQSRFVLNALSPFLQSYGVQGIGLVKEEPDRIPELEAAFPAWRFIALTGPEAVLRWLELRSALIVDREGRVQRPLLVLAGPMLTGLERLQEALEAVGR